MKTFREFIDKKGRETRKQLKILEKLLKHKGFKVMPFVEEDTPHIFVKATDDDLSFSGIRIYKIANMMAYRVQNEEKTQPFGRAYCLDVEEMFKDLVGDEGMTEEKAGHEVIEAVAKEIKKFFERSAEAEQDIRSTELDRDPLSKVAIRSTGTDYSSLVTARG